MYDRSVVPEYVRRDTVRRVYARAATGMVVTCLTYGILAVCDPPCYVVLAAFTPLFLDAVSVGAVCSLVAPNVFAFSVCTTVAAVAIAGSLRHAAVPWPPVVFAVFVAYSSSFPFGTAWILVHLLAVLRDVDSLDALSPDDAPAAASQLYADTANLLLCVSVSA